MTSTIPQGFEAFPADGSFGDVLQPFYMRFNADKEAQGSTFGLEIHSKHLNPMGICHGGVYMTLMDFCLSATICHRLEKFVGTPTISLSIDFLHSAKEGDFIWGEVESLRITNTVGFAHGVVKSSKGEVLARANGTFKLPHDLAAAAGITLDDLIIMRENS